MKNILLTFLTLTLTACGNYKTPSFSGDPAKMSADKLCFDYYGGGKDPVLGKEINDRNLDCNTLLRDDPLYPNRRDLESVHRIGR